MMLRDRAPFPATLPLSGLNGRNGVRLDGVAQDDASSLALAAAGDVNGDGIADIIVGAPGAGPDGMAQAGSSYVVFARRGIAPVAIPIPALSVDPSRNTQPS